MFWVAKKALLAIFIFGLALSLMSCSDEGGDSGSSDTMVTALPRTVSKAYGTDCNIQTAAQCLLADVRYAEYEECININKNLDTCQAFYDEYLAQVELCREFIDRFGC